MKKTLLAMLTLCCFACGDDDTGSNTGDGGADTIGSADSSAGDAEIDAGDDATTIRDSGSDSGRDASEDASDSGRRDSGPPTDVICGELPPSDGTVVRVSPSEANALPRIVREAAAGTVILLEDGTYRMTASGEGDRRLQFLTPGVTMRSASGNAEAVVIDGEYVTNEMIFIRADDVTIAHLTITHAVDHGIHVTGGAGDNTERTVLYGLRLIDHGEQFVKVNPNGDRDGFVDNGSLACSTFVLTDAGRPQIEDRFADGCYTGGIDAHTAWGWTVRHNYFEGIYCDNGGLAEHAVHFWSASRDTLVENNVIVNCARGVGFGLGESGRSRDYPDAPYPGVSYIGHYDGLIRGNVMVATHGYFDSGIELSQARGAKAYHNTIVSNGGGIFFSSIDYRFSNTQADIRNNIVERVTRRNDANGRVESNLEGADFSLFVDLPAGDGHLTAGATAAIDQGVALDDAGLDIDGESRDRGAPDLGADER